MEIEKNNLDNTDHWVGIELKDGQTRSYFELPTNQISTRRYTPNITVLGHILFHIGRLESICLLATLITILSIPNSSPFALQMYITEFIMILITYVIKEIYFDHVKSEVDTKTNHRTVNVYRGDREVQDLKWGEVKQGDIVYLTNGQIAPADLLLLDSQQIQHRQAIAFVDTKNVNGQIAPSKKKACYLTQMVNRGVMQKRNWAQYRKIITGKLNYQKPSGKLNQFTGYLKLSKDPKVEKLTIENLILRQSAITTSLWVYGLVIYTGMDSKVMMNIKNRCEKDSSFQQKLNVLYGVCLLLNLVFGLTFGLIYMLVQPERQSLQIAAYHFLMFSVLLPNLVYIGVNGFLVFVGLGKKIDGGIVVRNLKCLMSLGSIDFAVLTNIGVISSGEVLIDQIITPSSVYDIKGEQLPIHSNKVYNSRQRRHGSSARSNDIERGNLQGKIPFMTINHEQQLIFDKNQLIHDDDRFQIDDDTQGRIVLPVINGGKVPKIKVSLEPLRIDKMRLYNYVKQGEAQSTEILKALVLCHQAKLFYNPNKEAYRGLSSIKSEEVVLKLANYLGWELLPKLDGTKELGIIVKVEKQKMGPNGIYTETKTRSYDWVGINHFVTDRKLFSVVVCHDDKYTLYCKGNPQDMVDRLKVSKETQKLIDQTVTSYKANQSQAIIYANREMTLQEKQVYQSEQASLKLSLTTTQKEVEQFSRKYEKGLEFVCIVGLSSQVNPRAQHLFKSLTDCCIKVCMIGKKRSEIGIFKELLDKDNEVEYIYLQNQSSQLLRYYLDYATNRYKSKRDCKYAIVLSGQAWRLMHYNTDIMQHFMFVLYHSQGLFAFHFDSELAADLTARLKSSYPRAHGVLGIGYSYEDLRFLDKADVGIGLCQNLPADIVVQKLDTVVDILQMGPYFLNTLSQIVNLIIYQAVVLTTVILIYEIVLISHNASFTLNSTLVFIYVVVYSTFEIGFMIFMNRSVKKLPRPAFYVKSRNIVSRMYLSAIEAAVHGTTIIGAVLLVLPSVRVHGGMLLTAQALHFSLFLLLIFVGILRHIFNKSISKKGFLANLFLVSVLLTISVVLAAVIRPTFSVIALQFKTLFSNYDTITMLINTTIFCLSSSLLLNEVVKKRIFPEISDKVSSVASNESIKEIIRSEGEFTAAQLVSYLFKDQENMDASIADLVEEEIDVNGLKLNMELEIRNRQSHFRYLFQNFKKNSKILMVSLLTTQILLTTLILVSITTHQYFHTSLIPLCLSFFLIPITILYLYKLQHFMTCYHIASLLTAINVFMLFLYPFLQAYETDYYLLMCVLMVIGTQIIQIRLLIVIGICGLVFLANLVGVVVDWNGREDALNKVVQVLVVGIIAIANLHILRRFKIAAKTSFIIHQSFQKETNHINDVLSILVPKFVKNHLQKNLTNYDLGMQQEQKQAAILFCYVCDFAQIVKQEGKNVVLLMDQLFRQYDQLCHNFAVQKIETVGMTYMAATGIKVYEDQIENQMKRKNHVERLLKMAIQMLQKARSITWGEKKNKRMQIKIGINAGDVIVGVIGHHKPQFSLIGDTVNTTSRHCSTGRPGDIVLSENAFKTIKRFPVSSFQKVPKQMKGLGTVNTYRYLKNQHSQSRHLQVRARFIAAVKKVIQRLREEGKIKYKKFKASDLAKTLMELRNSTKKLTYQRLVANQEDIIRREGRRTSILCLQPNLSNPEPMQSQSNDQTDQKNDHVKHNLILQLTQRNPHYNHYITKKKHYTDRLMFLVLIFTYLTETIINVATNFYDPVFLSLRCLSIVGYVLMALFYRKGVAPFSVVVWVFSLMAVLPIVVGHFGNVMFQMEAPLRNFEVYFAMLNLTIISSMHAFRFVHVTVIGTISIILTMVLQIIEEDVSIELAYQVFYVALIVIRKYVVLQDAYKNYNQILTYQKRRSKQSKVVSQLLPKHAYQKLKNQNIENRLQLTDKFENATMLFADIKGFTAYSNRTTPAGVVAMLKQLFETFDKSCMNYNVYKVYTIGDCYVVLGFTDCYKRNVLEETKNVVMMGLSMVDSIREVRERLQFPELDMRIGIHTGTIIGGIIGTQIVRYDIYGPDVMIANKFQEEGKTGHIHISEATKEILDQDHKKSFNIVPNGTVKVDKLNAEINGYILTKKKFEL